MAVPVTLADAKRQLKLDQDDTSQDDELPGFIADAAAWVEKYTGHILVARDVTQEFTGNQPVRLDAWPIKPGAAVAISYLDNALQPVLVDGAWIEYGFRPARVIIEPIGGPWPWRVPQRRFSVTVRAGYEPDDPVPGNFRRAMLCLIGAYDEDREGGELLALATKSAEGLCRDFRLRRL